MPGNVDKAIVSCLLLLMPEKPSQIMPFNHRNTVEACLFTDINLIGSSSWFAVSFHTAVAISSFWWPLRKTLRQARYWKCIFRLSSQSTQIEPRIQSGFYSLEQSMSNEFNRWAHRETHFRTLSFLLRAIISYCVEQLYKKKMETVTGAVRAFSRAIKCCVQCPLRW